MNKFTRILNYVKLLPRLGFGNAIAVALYRYQCSSGKFKALLPVITTNDAGPFWHGDANNAALTVSPALTAAIIARADAICAGIFQRFGDIEIYEGESPSWRKGVYIQSAGPHFTDVAVNAVAGEDVKLTWDLSRMHWAPRLALAACVAGGDARNRYLSRLDHLTRDWLAHNAYQGGVNWACANEVALRGMQLMLSSLILEKHLTVKPTETLLTLIEQSWRRVYAVRGYARAQHNNHSLAEHLFLVYAAAFLAVHEIKVASKHTLTKLHENLAPLIDSLIMNDGGSVMYSSNYHRVFCDMLSFGKLFDDHYAFGLFSETRIQEKSKAAFDFLHAIIEPISGQMPLIGHNDGSLHCLQFNEFHSAEPSLLLMGATFGFRVSERTKRHEDEVWLFDRTPRYNDADSSPDNTHRFEDFGLLILNSITTRAYLKYPRHRYRPAQCDFGHFDLWVNGKNLLQDSGTYSYNPTEPSPCEDLSAAHAHNAPALAATPATPRLSPFLYAYWPNAEVTQHNKSLKMLVPIGQGAVIHREIEFTAIQITLTDSVHSIHPWQVHFHGPLTLRDTTSITFGDVITMQFENVERLAVTHSHCAPNYHALAASKRFAVYPKVMNKPIITTIGITV